MFDILKKEISWGGRALTLETGRIARQADGAVLASYGETTVLCTVVAEKIAKPGVDFLPLTVHFQEKSFAAGKIPGGFFKREGRPSEKEVLGSRLIDRPIRPLFPHGFHHEVQVICTLLSFDLENDPDIVAIIGASAALAISGIPFQGPLGAARVGFQEGAYVLNPTFDQLKTSQLDLVVAGTKEGVLMVESEAYELSEDVMLDAVMFGHESFQPVIKLINELAKEVGKASWEVEDTSAQEKKLYARVKKAAEKDLRAAYGLTQKAERYTALTKIRAATLEALVDDETSESQVQNQMKALEQEIVRGDILEKGVRIDGRDTKTIRPIMCEAGFLPRTHGSALFTRGETQAIVVATLGTAQDEQIVDALSGEERARFMLHYNFPPYSVGETGRIGSPGRREIGHGKLAWRALHPLMPEKDKFPYTVRVVSEVTESNGSSSMASVVGGSLALMDAGVPLKSPVAGIAMGLVQEGKNIAILSDILGDEDHLGDMDFKVAGTREGVTALQMDLKVTSITRDIMKKALAQAQEGRFHILDEMSKCLGHSRTEISENAPRIVSIQIAKEKIRELIGPGGKMIREICETTGTKIDISDDGKVDISGMNQSAIEAALEKVKIVAMEPEVGMVYKGVVAKIMDFGAFVNYMGEKSGLVHISQLSIERVGKVEDVVKAGDHVYVKFIGVDDRGKVKLSMKTVDQRSGKSLEETASSYEGDKTS